MSRLFNAYVMIDWSAASTPKEGKDSIWISVVKRDVRFRLAPAVCTNPPTREAAMVALRDILADLKRRNERALVGVDFSLGFPAGTIQALGKEVKTPDWAGLWNFLAANVVDKPNNVNNRFGVASKMNRLMTDQPRPFWGCPPKDAQRWLTPTKPVGEFTDVPPEFRHADLATRTIGRPGAKSAWQMFGAGTVGGQAMLGIPRLHQMTQEMGKKAQVWPFQTGWRALTAENLDGLDVVFAEIYPALVDIKAEPGEVIDRAQVRGMSDHFAKLDEAGKLGPAFAPPPGTDPDLVALVEREEGWILGL